MSPRTALSIQGSVSCLIPVVFLSLSFENPSVVAAPELYNDDGFEHGAIFQSRERKIQMFSQPRSRSAEEEREEREREREREDEE